MNSRYLRAVYNNPAERTSLESLQLSQWLRNPILQSFYFSAFTMALTYDGVNYLGVFGYFCYLCNYRPACYKLRRRCLIFLQRIHVSRNIPRGFRHRASICYLYGQKRKLFFKKIENIFEKSASNAVCLVCESFRDSFSNVDTVLIVSLNTSLHVGFS
jgi:hypothetical protein